MAAWTSRPVIGGTLIAPDLYDPDGEVANITYQWESQSSGEAWQGILFAETREYTPTIDDLNKFLRVIVRYDDGEGDDKSVISAETDPVQRPVPIAGEPPIPILPIGAALYGVDALDLEQFADIL